MLGIQQLDAHEFYAGAADRNRLERGDGEMIHEDRSAIANLPQGVMIKHYPMLHDYMPGDINDGIRGIDMQMSDDNRHAKMQLRPRKA